MISTMQIPFLEKYSLLATSVCERITDVNIIIRTFIIMLIIFIVIKLFKSRSRTGRLPPGPFPLPVLGNLLQIGTKPHIALQRLARVYGDVMTIQFGSKSIVVVNGMDAVCEGLMKKGHDFSGRSDSYIGRLVSSNGNDIVFADYGPQWKFHRQICGRGLKLLAGKSLCNLERTLVGECKALVERLRKYEQSSVDPQRDIGLVVMNSICLLVFGCGYTSDDPEFLLNMKYVEMIADGFEDSLGNMVEFFPWLKFLPIRSIRRLKQALKIRDAIMVEQLKRHRKKVVKGKMAKDFTDFLLLESEQECNRHQKEFLSDEHLKLLMFDLFGAGVDTTITAIRWAIVYLTHWPDVQRKIWQEIYNLTGNKRPVCLEDKKKLPFTEATVHETLRMCSLFPISPRKTTADTAVNGYHIPKGTQVAFNLWGVNHDEKYWEDPNGFKPERFLDATGKLTINRKLSLTFSAGKRACPGESIARNEVFLIIGYLIQNFHIKASGELPSLDPVPSVAFKPKPYKICFVERI